MGHIGVDLGSELGAVARVPPVGQPVVDPAGNLTGGLAVTVEK